MRSIHTIYLTFFIITVLLCGTIPSSIAQTDEEILVLVNETPITRRDLKIEAALLKTEMRNRNRSLSNNQMARLSRGLVENLIERELLYQQALHRKLKIQNRWIDKAVAELKRDLGNEAAYLAYLKSAELNEKQLRMRLKKGLIVRRLLRRDVIRQIKVSEAEMQAFYRKYPEFFKRQERIRVRQIMIGFDSQKTPTQREEALLRIQAVQHKLSQGENFTALALKYSEDTSKARGGDLGYLERSQMIKPLANAAFSLKPGEVSEIIETRLGYHLIKVVDKIPSSQMAYRNARTKIERTLRRNKEKAAAQKYLARLKRKATIQRIVKQ